MMYTVIPAFIISIVGYIFLGHQSGSADLQSVDAMVQTLHQGFWISPITLLPVAVLFLFARKGTGYSNVTSRLYSGGHLSFYK